jgi:hypothetical protein
MGWALSRNPSFFQTATDGYRLRSTHPTSFMLRLRECICPADDGDKEASVARMSEAICGDRRKRRPRMSLRSSGLRLLQLMGIASRRPSALHASFLGMYLPATHLYPCNVHE